VWENASSHSAEEFYNKFLDPHPGAYGLQNLISFSFTIYIHLWRNFHEDLMRNFYKKLQTDKRADKCRVLDNIIVGGNKSIRKAHTSVEPKL